MTDTAGTRPGNQQKDVMNQKTTGTPAALIVEDYDFGPDINERLENQIGKISGSGITGNLKDIAWVDGALDAVLTHAGFELSIKLNETTVAVDRHGEEHLDPNHQGESASGVRACFGRTGPCTVANTVSAVTRYSQVFDAWARGTVRSTSEVKFGIPFNSEDDAGSVNTSMIVETPGGSFEAVLAGERLEVHDDVAELSRDEARAFLLAVTGGAGATREDLVASLKACRAADLPA